MQRHFDKETRWRIMYALNAGRPYGCNENLLVLALSDAQLAVDINDIRRNLEYLEGHKLVELDRHEIWGAKLTSQGIDVVEYNADCPTGIGRPIKYW